ncbi:MAG: hypothetical protein EOO16_15535 [Chitinophagaceae bacterium]|nr:MAG: hypothetical protein EOO16_15535 [Chitinophagaceae bacterium]
MIHKIQLFGLRVDETIQFLPQLRAQFDGARNLPPTIVALLAELSGLEEDLDRLFQRDTAKVLTEKAMLADEQRDRRLSNCYGLVAIHAEDPDAGMAAAAARIQQVLDKYGSLTAVSKAGLNAETAIISNLLADLARPECAAAVATLGLDRWVSALKTANDAVNEAMLERARLNAESDLPYTMKEKRLEARRVYTKLLEKCGHFAEEVAYAEPWPALVSKINAITANYDHLIATRKGRAEKANV